MLKRFVIWSADLTSEIEMTTKLISEILDEMTTTKLCLKNKIICEIDSKYFENIALAEKIDDIDNFSLIFETDVVDDNETDDDKISRFDKIIWLIIVS